MICAQCSDPLPSDDHACPHCGKDPHLAARYRLDAVVGHGAQGTTYRATRLDDQTVVAVKELLVRKVESLKALELFEREARVLEQLQHPGVPRHLEDLQVEAGRSVALYLVQEFVEGQTLADELAEQRTTQTAIFEAAAELLDTLAYLHGLRPPVIHRDIKPANVMRRESDGSLVLIDFGSVRAAMDTVEGGSTVAGTFGYMSPEQFMGRAIPATDIYGLGATIVAALSGRDPQSMLGEDRTIHWRGRLGLDPPFAAILDRMLDPNPDTRAHDAAELAALIRAALRGESVPVLSAPGAPVVVIPPAPRDLPHDFRKVYAASSRFGMMFGAIFFIVGLFASAIPIAVAFSEGNPMSILVAIPFFLIFCGIGGRSMTSARKRLTSVKHVYQHGAPGVATITDVGRSSYSVNDRHANVYHYAIDGAGGSYEGEHHSWKALDLRPGDAVTVLHDPADPGQSLIFEPERYTMRRGGPRSREVVAQEVVFSAGDVERGQAEDVQPEEQPAEHRAW